MDIYRPSKVTIVGFVLLVYVVMSAAHAVAVGTLGGWLGDNHLVYLILSFPGGLLFWLSGRDVRVPGDLARLGFVVNQVLFPAVYTALCTWLWWKADRCRPDPRPDRR